MRIGYDAFPIGHTHGGIGVYASQLLKSMVACAQGEEHFFAYLPQKTQSDPFVPSGGGAKRLTWIRSNRFSLRWRGATDHLDLYHGTNFKFHTQGRHGVVLNIHDLWLDRHPEYSKKLFGQQYSTLRAKRRAKKATHIIAISKATAMDIEECYEVASEKISVVYPAVSDVFYPDRQEEAFLKLQARLGLQRRPYILFIGGADPRKNHQVLFEAFADSSDLKREYCIVAVGDPSHHFGNFVESAKRFNILDRVVLPGSVSLEELRLLYSYAETFVFPSRCEGFGFPGT